MIRIASIAIISIAIMLGLGFGTLIAPAQVQETQKAGRSGAKVEAVQYLYPEQVTVPAGKPTSIALHFRVAPGLHINAHATRDEFLIPTEFSIPGASGVRLENAEYPPGKDFKLPVEPGTTLSVYTGDFAIQSRIVAQPGDHLVEAKLRYQACDQNACLPPKTITVPIDVIAR